MVSVSVALLGTRVSAATHLFMGWFGPRGLASIVLGLIYLEQEAHTTGMQTVQYAVMATVLVSIMAHGATAMPGISLYERKLAAQGSRLPEHEEDRA
jgi:NhaP-type Na+/H+ or K+/H+ antiporter